MITRMVTAAARAILVALLIAMPALALPGVRAESAQVVALLSLAAAMLTFVEYVSDSPSLIEFRDAAPFNRIRFVALFAIVAMLTLICRGLFYPSPLTETLSGIGADVGATMDFPFSPVRLMVLVLPEDAPDRQALLIRALAGLSYLTSLTVLVTFVALVRLMDWPIRRGAFNFWVNLPLYDPTAGGDILMRLKRGSHINVALGFLLPFLIPAALKAASAYVTPLSPVDPQTLIWTMAAWAFLPASLIMRGVALMRIAVLIEEKRRRAYAQAHVQPA
ncbi:hypothetical protein [Ponticoccus alexandrii]|uniref:Uncharacterized protein n=1 Tax=Ponticoccus alexandrii TaxID=1943633 RepID=A0ABX7FCG0_9RHOB|nr:hypothetical protein [Ponticoccus alexandrii]QRF68179.1 hypothetical protein GQA70_18790 [Ponticoccus alexandrii]